jgi:hypothetical protein
VSRLENEVVLGRMQARLAKCPGVLDLRHETVEHPFGTVKEWMSTIEEGSPAFPKRVEDVGMKAGETKITPLKAITPEATSHTRPRPAKASQRARSQAGC